MTGAWVPKAAAACFVLGCLLVFLIEAGIARAVGVPLIFVGIFLGVTAITSPGFLEADRER